MVWLYIINIHCGVTMLVFVVDVDEKSLPSTANQ